MQGPIFIVGCPRSGTTLLRSILNAHSRIAIPRETRFFPIMREDNVKRGKDILDIKDFNEFWVFYSQHRRFIYQNIDSDEVLKNISNKGKTSYKIVLDAFMETLLKKTGKQRWGEKTPGHEFYLKEIFEFYPDAKILFMIRDPRAVAASLKKVKWNNNDQTKANSRLTFYIKRWNLSVKVWQKYIDNPNILTIKYEDLVTDTQNQLKSICRFIDEEYDGKMLVNRNLTNTTVRETSWTADHEMSVARSIDNKSINKWANDLSAYEIAAIEKFTDPAITDFGYKKCDSYKLGPLDYFKYYYLFFYSAVKSRLARINIKSN